MCGSEKYETVDERRAKWPSWDREGFSLEHWGDRKQKFGEIKGNEELEASVRQYSGGAVEAMERTESRQGVQQVHRHEKPLVLD
jgi:hypothetical protein